jgi:transposase
MSKRHSTQSAVWKIKINASKTQAIYFSRCTKNVPQTEITLNGDGIPWSDEVKYLGVLLDKRLKLVFHSKYCTHSSIESQNCASQTSCYSTKFASGQFSATALSVGMIDCAATHRRHIQIIQNKQLESLWIAIGDIQPKLSTRRLGYL